MMNMIRRRQQVHENRVSVKGEEEAGKGWRAAAS